LGNFINNFVTSVFPHFRAARDSPALKECRKAGTMSLQIAPEHDPAFGRHNRQFQALVFKT
jgi:hypothetical protein